MRNIEIHGTDPQGTHYVLNHFNGDNAAVNSDINRERARAKLWDQAISMAGRWAQYLPHDKIEVVEV